jgi:general L-amino acid transport system permease protein
MVVQTMRPEKTIRISWYDERFRGLFWQVLVVSIVVAVIAWLCRNAVHNLDARRISTGFGFLSREAGMPIADTLIAYNPSDTYVRALLVGVLNTIRVAAIGVVLATIL